MRTAARRSPAISRAADRPSSPGILMSRITRSGRRSRTSSTASSPRPVSPTTSYCSSWRSSLRSRRMIASSSAITTRVGRGSDTVLRGSAGGQFGRDAVEEGVLLRLELAHGAAQRLRLTGLRIGVTAGVARLDVGEGRLRHQRTEADVLRLLLQEAELLLGDRELGADALETLADVDQSTLQEGLRHRDAILDGRCAQACPRFGRPTGVVL